MNKHKLAAQVRAFVEKLEDNDVKALVYTKQTGDALPKPYSSMNPEEEMEVILSTFAHGMEKARRMQDAEAARAVATILQSIALSYEKLAVEIEAEEKIQPDDIRLKITSKFTELAAEFEKYDRASILITWDKNSKTTHDIFNSEQCSAHGELNQSLWALYNVFIMIIYENFHKELAPNEKRMPDNEILKIVKLLEQFVKDPRIKEAE